MQVESFATLAPVLQSPLRKALPFSLSTRHLADVLISTNKSHDPRTPDSEAVRFYAMNQLIGLLQAQFTPNEKLPDWAAKVVEAYHRELVEQHRRMVWYTFIIITREFRHLKNPGTILAKAEYPTELKGFHGKISDSTAEVHLNSWLTAMPDIQIAKYCEAITKQFDTGSYGGGYGGKPWGQIARTLFRYVAGEISAEAFIDTGYTLAHNNGPMFNKGMQYGMYTNAFKRILDVQRSGQICEGIAEGTIKKWVPIHEIGSLEQMVMSVKKQIGKVGDYIDWHKVEALGSLDKYPAEKAAQDKKYGKPQDKPIILDGKVVKVKAEFEVFPGQKVEIYERLKEAA